MSGAAKGASILVLLLTLVTAAVVAGSQASPTSASSPAPTPGTAEGELAARLSERARTVGSRLTAVQQAYEQLATLSAPLDHEVSPAQASADQLAVRLEALRAVLHAAGADGMASIADLETRVSEAKRQRDALAQRQASVAANPSARSSAPGLTEDASMRGRQALVFTLVKNRVVPRDENHYSARRAQVRSSAGGPAVDVVVVERTHDGEPAGEAVRPSGTLNDWLSKADPLKQYVLLLVCDDSIGAFRLISAELTRRGFPWAWDTGRDEPIVRRLSDLGSSSDLVPEGVLPRKK